ncbi:MAG TPA: sugar ABC transporter permease [Candidatus Methylomirabilis sp.]|nr:sugar ABC transporter permease [Candidatus Methylomirabilis sp.]
MGATHQRRWYLIPGLVFLLGIDLLPLVYALGVSLFNWWLVRPQEFRFVGLGNYLTLAADPAFGRAVLTTCVFTVGSVIGELLAGLALALLFAQPFAFLRLIRTILLLPLFVVPVVGSTMWRLIFHPDLGVLNYYLSLMGLGQPAWLGDRKLAMIAIVLVDAWRTIPFMFLVIHAGLETLPSELYEAARVDGASWFQSFRYITVPLLTYIMLLAVLIRGMDAFREFDIIFVLTGGGPGTSTQTIQLLNYRVFGLGHMGMANAVGIVTLALVAIACLLLIRAVLRPR